MVLAEIVTAITTLIGLFKVMRNTYDWGTKVLSIECQKEYVNYADYLEGVERTLTPYKNGSKTSIEGTCLKLLEGELKEAWSFVDKWMKKTGLHKRLKSDAFIKKLQTSRTTIAQNLHLFTVELLSAAFQATPHTNEAGKHNIAKVQNTNQLPVGSTKVHHGKDHEGNDPVPHMKEIKQHPVPQSVPREGNDPVPHMKEIKQHPVPQSVPQEGNDPVPHMKEIKQHPVPHMKEIKQHYRYEPERQRKKIRMA